jgi:hypothetical protein
MQFPRVGVELGGLGGGVAEASADDFDGDAGVDEFGGVGVAELVDVDLDSGLLAVVGVSVRLVQPGTSV